MAGKTVLVTGATQGIGRETAAALVQMGARVGIVGRDRARTQAVADALRAEVPGATVDVFVADLSLAQATRRLAAEVKQRYAKLDVLVNNAGAVFSDRAVTAEGLERTFALNHLSYFLLTNELLGLLEASGDGRVVSVSSEAHRGGHVIFDDLQSEKSYSGFRVYSTSKLENILFTRELARRLAERGARVTANCLHPGVIASGFARNNKGLYGVMARLLAPLLTSPAKGARTSVHLASSPEVASASGQYFKDRRLKQPTREAQSDAVAKRLWEETEKIAARV
jgi:NAD(P)-dependent dehydrogenase (short-subunit alcohol dehydrogenase family)